MTSLERNAHAAVDHAAVERGPGVDGPAAVGPWRRKDERIVCVWRTSSRFSALTNTAQPAETPLTESADQHVRPSHEIDTGSLPASACR